MSAEIKKYTWDFNPEAEVWYNNTFGSIEECIEDAKAAVEDENSEFEEKHDVIYIAETKPFIPNADIESIFEQMVQDAYDQCGESAETWEPYGTFSSSEFKELKDEINEVINGWLKERDRYPCIYNIDNIEEYPLEV